jgi:hypothetical protein
MELHISDNNKDNNSNSISSKNITTSASIIMIASHNRVKERSSADL